MFQPKWGGTPTELYRVMELALATPARMEQNADSVLDVLFALDFTGKRDEEFLDKIFKGLLLKPDGWLAGRPALRATLAADLQAARKNGHDARAWQRLAKTLGATGELFRMSRGYPDLGPAERNALFFIYRYWQIASICWKVVEPKNGAAYLELSRSQAFCSGDAKVVAANADRAIALAPNDADANRWALTRLQPQWYPDRPGLWKAMRRVEANRKLALALAGTLAGSLPPEEEIKSADEPLAARINARLQTAAAQADAGTQRDLFLFFMGRDRLVEAETAAKKWVQLAPRDAVAEYRLAGFLHNHAAYDEAEVHYRRALALDPDFAPAAYYLASIIMSRPAGADKAARAKEAEALYRRVTVLLPLWPKPWNELGQLLFAQKRQDEAIAAFRQVVRLSYGNEQIAKDAVWRIHVHEDKPPAAATAP